jgi:hypothetical protein
VLAGLQEAAQQPICIKRNFIVAYLGVLRLNLAPWKWRAYLFLAREISPCKPKYLRPLALGTWMSGEQWDEVIIRLKGNVQEDEAAEAELQVKTRAKDSERRGFKKRPDTPLGLVLAGKRAKKESK